MEESILDVSRVTKTYDKFKALDDVSLKVPRGTIYGLLGPNGAGKTTLIRIINQIIGPDTGEVIFNGNPMQRKDVENIGYLPEERGLYPKMKVGEQLIYLSRLKGLSRTKANEEVGHWLQDFDILDWWDKKVEEMSKGMAQKLQFIATVVHRPNFIILDEPFSGFDPINAELVKQKILKLKENGTTVMLSTHRMENVEELCEHLAMINQSRKVLDGDIASIKEQYRARRYEVILRGKLSENDLGLDKALTIESIKYQPAQDQTQLRIEVPKTWNTNDLLNFFMRHQTMEGFQEILPSMHDIFLATVNEANHA